MGKYPTKDVPAWLGNRAPIAMKRDATKRVEVFQKAIKNGVEKAVQQTRA